MSSPAAVRAAGHPWLVYPERDLPPEPWHEARARELVQWLLHPLRVRSARVAGIVPAVQAAAARAAATPDADLPARARALGRQMRREGFRREPAGAAFALVREAASRRLGQRHYDVQLAGGWALLNGLVAEMDTGEGKTLTATLAAASAALAGVPVHVITVNDYLATRDAAAMAPVYEALGLRVGVVHHGLEPAARRAAYACDVTYCANKEVAFDYLRDRLAIDRASRRIGLRLERLRGSPTPARLLLRGLHFAIVDEADGVLVDEARTPLILSAGAEDDRAAALYAEAVALARILEAGRDFRLEPRRRRVELSDGGHERLQRLTAGHGGVWQGPRRRAELVTQALTALHFYSRDVHYVVRDGTVQIVDEYTGRVLADRSWEQGLHQMVEAKEGLPPTGRRAPLVRTSYQRFFRRYLHLAGMTGTAREVATELRAVYGLEVARIPTHRPSRRRRLPTHVLPGEAAKWEALGARVEDLHGSGRPVLVGTRSVAASERASAALRARDIPHRVLSATQDRDEAAVVAAAGAAGAVTVATNMAGRGTDILLGAGVAAAGGLHVLGTELHDARRIDRQLFGRCGRQGDPGTCEMLLCLEDELALRYAGMARRAAARLLLRAPGGQMLAGVLLRRAQRRAEQAHLSARRRLLKADARREESLAFSGSGRWR